MSELPVCPPPDPATRRPAFAVPPLACDTHVHVFGPPERYPCQASRSYTPPPGADLADLARMYAVLGITRAVIVQASAYGTDNRMLLAALASDSARYRGIAAVGADTTDRDLARLHEAGVRGIRVNLVDKGGMPFASLDALTGLAERVGDLGWHIEFLVHVEADAGFRRLARTLPVPVSVAHVGYMRTGRGLGDAGYQEFLALLRDGICWVKLTGPYRISSRNAFPYDDVEELAAAVIEAAPDRILWGSDWPHVMHFRPMPNDGDLLDSLARVAPDPDLREAILCRNPARLYGFG